MEIHDKEQKKKELEKMYELAKSNYKKNVVELSESDKFYIMNKNLWIYFLAEPKRVQECIKEVQRKAAERGSSSLRALSITLSRPWVFLNQSDVIFLKLILYLPCQFMKLMKLHTKSS